MDSKRTLFYQVVWLLLAIPSCWALFEDQVGQVDWSKPFIGEPTCFDYVANTRLQDHIEVETKPFFTFSAEKSTLAALNGKNGNIIWRNKLMIDDVVAADILSLPKDLAKRAKGAGLDLIFADLFLVLATKEKVYVYSFDGIDGTIIFESVHNLKNEVSSVQILFKTHLIVRSSGALYVFDVRDGKLLFEMRSEEGLAYADAAEIESKIEIAQWNSAKKTIEMISLSPLSLTTSKLEIKFTSESSPFFVKDSSSLIVGSEGGLTTLYDVLSKTISTTALKAAYLSKAKDHSGLSPLVLSKGSLYKLSSGQFVELKAGLGKTAKSVFSITTDEFFVIYADKSFAKVKNSRTLFVREEALASIISKPVAIELPRFLDLDVNSTDNSVDALLLNRISDSHGKFHPELFVLRLRSQLALISETFVSLFSQIGLVANQILGSNGEFLINMYQGKIEAKHYSFAEKHNFGFLNIISLVSSDGTFFGLSSDNGDIVFKNHLPGFHPSEFQNAFLVRAKAVGPHPPCIALIFKSKIMFVNGVTGELISSKDFTSSIQTYFRSSSTHDKIVVVLADLRTIWTVNEHESVASVDADESSFFFKLNEGKDNLSGYTLNNGKITESFKVSVPENHKILHVEKHVKDTISTVGRNIGGGSVMIKYVNENLIAIFSSQDATGLLVQLIDGRSGAIVAKYEEPHCEASSVTALLYENNFIYTCFSRKNARTEVNSIALYWDLIIDKYELNLMKMPPRIKELKKNKGEIMIEQKGFFMSKLVSTLSVSKTLRGVTEKAVIVGFSNGQIALLPQKVFDPRRPVGGKLTEEEKEEGLITYSPMIPIVSHTILSYFTDLEGVNTIETFPTKLESTTLVFSTGLDIYHSRAQPSSGFDLLPEEFNYYLLIAMVIGLFFAVIFLQQALSKKKLNDQWK